MLYIVERLSDSHYLSFFEHKQNRIEFEFTPLKSDALMLPQNIAEDYMHMIMEMRKDEYKMIPGR